MLRMSGRNGPGCICTEGFYNNLSFALYETAEIEIFTILMQKASIKTFVKMQNIQNYS